MANEMKVTDEHKKPEKTIRIALLRVSLFRNETEKGDAFYNASFSRGYRDALGKWQNSSSFSVEHLSVIRSLAKRAEDYIVQHTQRDES